MLKLKSNTLTLSLAVAACIAAPSAFAQDAQSQPQPPQPPQTTQQEAPPAAAASSEQPAQKSWSELDVNNNGSLSSSEAAPMDSLAKVFVKADADGNGELTQDEYKTWLASNNSKQKPKHGG